MLKQMGGEGKENYKGNKSDMSLSQHGGEGGDLKVKGLDVAFTPSKSGDQSPGKTLKIESN